MERKQADPACRMDSIRMGVITLFRHIVRNIMNGNDPVEQNQEHEN